MNSIQKGLTYRAQLIMSLLEGTFLGETGWVSLTLEGLV